MSMDYKVLKYSRYYPESDIGDSLQMFDYFSAIEDIQTYCEKFPDFESLLYIQDKDLDELDIPADVIETLVDKIKSAFPVQLDWEHPKQFLKQAIRLHKIINKVVPNLTDFVIEGIPESVLDKIYDKISIVFNQEVKADYYHKENLAKMLGVPLKSES